MATGSWVQKSNILKNLLQNCLVQVLESWYIVLPGGSLPNWCKPRFQGLRWPHARGSYARIIEMIRNILRTLFLQNHLAQMFEFSYVALPSGLLPSLFK